MVDEIAQIENHQKKYIEYYLYIIFNVICIDFRQNDKQLAMDDIGISKHTMVESDENLREIINKRPDKYWEPRV